MPTRQRLASSILANVPAIGVATSDEMTFFNYLKNMFHSTPARNDVTAILRWTWPSGLQYHTRDGISRVSLESGNEINEFVVNSMIRDLTSEVYGNFIFDPTPVNNAIPRRTSKSFFQQQIANKEARIVDAFSNERHYAILVLPDFHQLWTQPLTLRAAKESLIALENTYNKIIFTFPMGTEIPTEIQSMMYVEQFDSPDIHEFESLIYFWLCEQADSKVDAERDKVFRRFGFKVNDLRDTDVAGIEEFLDPDDCGEKDEAQNPIWTPGSVASTISGLAQSLTGLTWAEGSHTLIMSYQNAGYLSIQDVQKSKITYLNSHPALTVHPPEKLPNFDDIGGYQDVKHYLAEHMAMFLPSNRDRVKRIYGDRPQWFKGGLMLGVPGTGKSLVAKALGREFGMLVVELDVGKIMDKFVGASEANMDRVIEIMEKAAGDRGIVVIFDEIEKQLAGNANAGASDAGVTSRVHRRLLTWMNDREKPVVIVATANDIEQLPTELLRPGRIDVIFFFDIPGPEARKGILNVHLNKFKEVAKDVDIETMAVEKLDGFTGAEIEQLVKECMTQLFHDGTDIINDALLDRMIPTIKLQSVTHSDKIQRLRDRANEFRKADTEVWSPTSKRIKIGAQPTLHRTTLEDMHEEDDIEDTDVNGEVDLGL